MGTHHGKDGVLKIGVAGAQSVAEIVDFSYEETVATVDDGAKGDTYETHLNGRKKWTGEATANFDSSDTAGLEAMTAGASVVLNLYPEGAAAAAKYKTGTVTVTKRGVSVPLDGKVSLSFSFQGNGVLSDAVVGA
jgi:hypothetical protein